MDIGHNHILPVDEHVNVVRVVQGLGLAPDHGEGGSNVRSPEHVGYNERSAIKRHTLNARSLFFSLSNIISK